MATIKAKNATVSIGDRSDKPIEINYRGIDCKGNELIDWWIKNLSPLDVEKINYINFMIDVFIPRTTIGRLVRDFDIKPYQYNEVLPAIKSLVLRYRILCRHASRSPMHDRYKRYLRENYGSKI